MAIIKCKMCGGDLVIEPGSTVAECEFCGSKQTIPNQDDDKKLTLFARANRLRMGSEFDKAAGIYESIVADFPEEAEAYWGLVLCKYGIEYVDDPASGRKIPTCHRSSFDSVMDDKDFEQACENADGAARRVYRDEAKAIEEIRKGIIEVSGKEEPYDIFICYKETAENGDRTIDSVIAQDVYDALTAKGYRVFFSRITLEDKLGQEYEPYIFAALNSANIMLAFGTDYEYYNAVWVKNEWSRYLKLMAKDKSKHLIPCYKNIDAYDMPKEFAKLQAQDMGKVGAMQDLLRGIEKILPKETASAAPVVQERVIVQSAGGPSLDALLSRGYMALEDKAFKEASGYFNDVLNNDPKCAQAYLGLFMADIKARNQTHASEIFIAGNCINNRYYQRCKQFADTVLYAELTDWEQKRQSRLSEEAEKARIKEAEDQQEQERQRKIEAAKQAVMQKKQKELKKRRDELKACQGIISAGDATTVALKSDGTTIAIINGEYSKLSGWNSVVAVSGWKHIVGIQPNGRAIVFKQPSVQVQSECDVYNWNNIVAISAARYHTVGLKSNGTVVAVGRALGGNNDRCEVSQWTGIVAVSAGLCTLGLRANGTVVAAGAKHEVREVRGVYDWSDIVAIGVGTSHAVGLKSDGTVVAVGKNYHNECNVSKWTDIVAISAGDEFTVGLKLDGTVVAVGNNEYGQCNVSEWENIVAICAGQSHTVGLKSDGTVVAAGDNRSKQCNLTGWTLAQNPLNFRVELKQNLSADLTTNRNALDSAKAELANCRGLFSGFRKKELEQKVLDLELKITELRNQINYIR